MDLSKKGRIVNLLIITFMIILGFVIMSWFGHMFMTWISANDGNDLPAWVQTLFSVGLGTTLVCILYLLGFLTDFVFTKVYNYINETYKHDFLARSATDWYANIMEGKFPKYERQTTERIFEHEKDDYSFEEDQDYKKAMREIEDYLK